MTDSKQTRTQLSSIIKMTVERFDEVLERRVTKYYIRLADENWLYAADQEWRPAGITLSSELEEQFQQMCFDLDAGGQIDQSPQHRLAKLEKMTEHLDEMQAEIRTWQMEHVVDHTALSAKNSNLDQRLAHHDQRLRNQNKHITQLNIKVDGLDRKLNQEIDRSDRFHHKLSNLRVRWDDGD